MRVLLWREEPILAAVETSRRLGKHGCANKSINGQKYKGEQKRGTRAVNRLCSFCFFLFFLNSTDEEPVKFSTTLSGFQTFSSPKKVKHKIQPNE